MNTTLRLYIILIHLLSQVYRLICEGSVEDQMLDRLRRKLFLSLKIMGSETLNDQDQDATFKTREIMDILRKGSSALSRTTGLPLSHFLDASIEEILQASRSREDSRTIKIKKELGEEVKDADETRLVADAEEEERKLLSGVAQVQSRLFEGRVIQRVRDNKQVAAEWQELQKRARKTRIVTIDGYEVLAEHLGPEAVGPSTTHTSTQSLTDMLLQDISKPQAAPKKSRRKFESEDWCIHCRDGGDLVLCSHCPRGRLHVPCTV